MLAVATFGLVRWATNATDSVEIARQKTLMSSLIGDLRVQLAHDQESSTVWDEAVIETTAAEPSRQWLDLNLGSWMSSYFGIDDIYVVQPDNHPIYVLDAEGAKAEAHFRELHTEIAPLLDRLRARLRAGDAEGIGDTVRSIGESDFIVHDGHPAIISLKPIVSETGDVRQVPGEEPIHIAMRYLDGAFAAKLAKNYQFNDLRFAPPGEAAPGRESEEIVDRAGKTVGAFTWKPFLPGSDVFNRIEGALAVALGCLMLAIAAMLGSTHRRRTLERDYSVRIARLVHHDFLTGLPNRPAFEDLLDATIAQRAGAVLFLDLDHFKTVNDTHGHVIGDAVVCEVARRLNGICGAEATPCRIGGDEFVVLAPGFDTTRAKALADAAIDALRAPIDAGDARVFIEGSIGIAPFAALRDDRIEVMRKADVALYQAKAAGRACASVYDGALDAALRRRGTLAADLRVALETGNGIAVHYQPICDAATHRIVAVEALARWHHPTFGDIPPSEFIPVAEASPLITMLGAHVLETACRAAAAWPIEVVAVNVSPVQLRDRGFARTVAEILARTGLAPHRLEIEITESAWLDPRGTEPETLVELHALGVHIALDDFGTGFSSPGRLSNAVFDRIKIDQSFVRHIIERPDDVAIVRAVVDLATAKGLKTTAEGVETAEAATLLALVGCDWLQGYWFSRPLPYAGMAQLLHEHVQSELVDA